MVYVLSMTIATLLSVTNVYSGTWPSNPDTLGPEMTVLIIEMSPFQELKMYYGKPWRIISIGSSGVCPH